MESRGFLGHFAVYLFVNIARFIGNGSGLEMVLKDDFVFQGRVGGHPSNRVASGENILLIRDIKRRDIDYCKSIIHNYESIRVDSCTSPGKISPICDRKECPNKPSPPSQIHVDRNFLNRDTKNPELKIKWKEPKFGLNNLCGYQISIASLRNNLQTICRQLNSKNQLSYVEDGVQFGGRYNITIRSLPAFTDLDQSSNYIEVEIPDKCQVYKDSNEILPWECELPRLLNTTSCINGTINITLEKPKSGKFLRYHLMVLPGSSRTPNAIVRNMYSKDVDVVTVSDLPAGLKYVALMFYEGKHGHGTASKKFTCKGETSTISIGGCKNQEVVASWKEVTLPNNELIFIPRVKPVRRNASLKKNHQPVLIKDRSSVRISNLKNEVEYIVQVDVALNKTGLHLGSFTSPTFSCKGLTRIQKNTHQDGDTDFPTNVILYSLFTLTMLLFAVCLIIVCRRYKVQVRSKLFFCLQRQESMQTSLIENGACNLPGFNPKPKVLVVFPSGCEYIDAFAALLGNLLNNMGCDCILDLYMRNEADEHGGRDLFIMNKLDEADYIVIINYKDTWEVSQTAMKVHNDIILRSVFSNKINVSKLIPIYFEVLAEVGNLSPLFFIENVREQLGVFVRKIYNVSPYAYSTSLPVRNDVEFDENTLKELKCSVDSIRKKQHPKCTRPQCLRGSLVSRTSSSSSLQNLDTCVGGSFQSLGSPYFEDDKC